MSFKIGRVFLFGIWQYWVNLLALPEASFLWPLIVFISRGSWRYKNYFRGSSIVERLRNNCLVAVRQFSNSYIPPPSPFLWAGCVFTYPADIFAVDATRLKHHVFDFKLSPCLDRSQV
jgi:hypothetical protein